MLAHAIGTVFHRLCFSWDGLSLVPKVEGPASLDRGTFPASSIGVALP